jgi:circadian clock protein KaiC
MAFNQAERGVPTVFVTMLTESHARMLLHLRSLKFFRQEEVGTRIHYVSGAGALKEKGAQGLLELLTQLVRDKAAKLLIIDGFTVVRDQIRGDVLLREFLQSLSVRSALSGCTTFLLSAEARQEVEVEHAMADGILFLSVDRVGLQATRGLDVVKFRGSNNLPGRHAFTIDQHGVTVFPRYEALNPKPSEKVADPDHRSRWGVAGLDAMCGGGLVTLSSTVLMGNPGCGKTLLGLHFLVEGARGGERGLYFGFAEGRPQLLRKASSVGLPLGEQEKAGLLRLESRAPVEMLPDAMAQELVELVDVHRFRRVFLDGLEPFAREVIAPERTPRFLAALLNALRDRDVTVLMAQQANELFGPVLHPSIRGVDALCDNLLLLRFFELDGRLHRLISVLKMRDSDNDASLRQLSISSTGVGVGQGYTSLEALITGQPRKRGGEQP